MRPRMWVLVVCAVLLVVLTVSAAWASSAAPTFPIPGLAAKGLQVGGVSRLNDGGALIAGSLNDKARTPDWHPVVARLRLDGSVDLGYGGEGVTSLKAGADVRSTSLAIDPQSGDAWIGLATGDDQGVLAALNGQGGRRSRFGHDGMLALGKGQPPVALAWRSSELLVASGTEPCSGCRLTLIDPSTGTTIARTTLMPASGSSTGCVAGSITSAVLVDSHTAQLAYTGARPCITQLVTVAVSGRTGEGSLQSTSTTPLGATATSDLVSAVGSDSCVAASSPAFTEFGPLVGGRQRFAQRRAPGGQLIALVPLGQGACAVLITNHQNPGGLVVQTSLAPQPPTRDLVPRSVRALGMFRCHAHLLVIGARANGHARLGTVVVIPVRRGLTAATARPAVADHASARCR